MIRSLFLLVFMSCFSLVAFATPHYSLEVYSINAIKQSEAKGDELYFHLVYYPVKGHARVSRVPRKPLHWRAHNLHAVGKVILWQGELAANAGKLIIALHDQDISYFSTDELLGSLQLSLREQAGKLKPVWQTRQHAKVEKIQTRHGVLDKITFTGAGSEYAVYVKIDGYS